MIEVHNKVAAAAAASAVSERDAMLLLCRMRFSKSTGSKTESH